MNDRSLVKPDANHAEADASSASVAAVCNGATSRPVADGDRFMARMHEAGLPVLGVDAKGEVNGYGDTPTSSGSENTRVNHGVAAMMELIRKSPLARRNLRDCAMRWNEQEHPAASELVNGVWAVPLPILNRRRRNGYRVAIIVTSEFLHAEQLAAMCQAASMDLELCRNRLRDLPPAAQADVGRLAALVRHAFEDTARALSDKNAIDSIGKQLAESYEEMNLLYTITQSMTVQIPPETFVAQACRELLATIPYSWIGLQLSDDRSRLKSLAGRLIIAGELPAQDGAAGNRAGSSVIRSITQLLMRNAHADTPMVIEPHKNPAHAAFSALGSTVLVHPVAVGTMYDEASDDGDEPRASHAELFGILLAGDKRGPDSAASNIDIKLLGATAAHMSIFLENAALYDDLNAMFLGTLEALTASIDAKDRYTCGHSRRVAHLTQLLARTIGLDDHTVSRCHIAGLVHDVGKIGVPEAVLTKPGKLNDEEFAWIRRHPEIGFRILKDIPQLSDVLPGVLYHHERWDGRGYPEGLRGDGIPLFARLIGLADSFDAMSSTRTYRSALSRDEVLAEIKRCAGSQFDPELAHAFIRLDFSTYDRMAQEHQANELIVQQDVTPKEKAA